MDASNEDLDGAIVAANEALPAWRAKTAKERAAVLRKWYNLIIENQESLAHIMTMEQGKPLAESRGEIVYGANYVGGLPRKPSAFTAILFLGRPVTSASW